MKSRTIGVAALLLLAAASPASSWTCSTNCTCGRGPGYVSAECPSNRRSLTVRNEVGQYMQVTCHEPNTDLNILQSFDVGTVPCLIFKQCSLPQKNYSDLLESMRVVGLNRLDICDSNLLASDLKNHLFGLHTVTNLSLNSLGLTDVPKNFLENVQQIVNLDMRYNKLQLPLGFFDYVPNLRILELGENSLTHIEPRMFRNLTRLYRLNVWGNRLQNLTRESFIGLDHLVVLELSSNGIQEFADNVFAELQNLRFLSLVANNFTRLPSNLLRNTSRLETVRMNENRRELDSLPPGLFANLTQLREVFLHRMFLSKIPEDLFHGSVNLINITLFGNNLQMLPKGLFRDATHLLKLDLSNNKLEHLPDNIFSALYELQFLDLSNNQLTTINEYLFMNTNSITTLLLQQNAITDVHHLAFFNLLKLRTIDMSRNLLTLSNSVKMGYSSPFTNCKSLKYLYLSDNSIDAIFDDWKNVMLELRMVDLSHNKLTSIEVEDLIFLSRHVKLNLTYNTISTINLYGSEAINSIGSDGGTARNTTVYLDGNPLRCDCRVYDFLRYLKLKIARKMQSRFDLVAENLECVSPPLYEGTRVSTISLEHFVCGCDDTKLRELIGCPKNCTCCAKLYSKALIVDCTDAGLSQAPKELPHGSHLTLSQTQLLLRGNNITRLPNATQPGYKNVTLLDVSYNHLRTLQVAQLPPRLTTLNLDHNHLTELDRSVLNFLANRTFVTLNDNPWSCNCNNRDLLTFLQTQFKQVLDLRNITCIAQNGSSLALSRMTVDDICPLDTALIVTLGITIGVVGLLLGLTATLYYRYHREVKVWLYAHNLMLWWVTEDELDKDKLFDAFVSFSHKDEEFVVNDLVPGLESGPKPFKLCLHFRDWIAGEFIPVQIARSVNESRRTLVVLSPNFLESIWGRMEFRAAHQQALSEGRARVILLLYGDIGPMENLDHELQAYLRMNTYVKWGDPWFWDKLRYALPHRSPIKEKHYHLNAAAVSDKMDLMFPAMSTPAATTPPADAVNPVFIIDDKVAVEKEAKLNGQLVFTDPSGGYVKCV